MFARCRGPPSPPQCNLAPPFPMSIHVAAAIESIERCLREADSHFWDGRNLYDPGVFNEDNAIAEYHVELAFVQLLVLLECLGLNATYQRVARLYQNARKRGLLKSEMGIEDPCLTWCEKIRMYVDGIAGAHGLDEATASGMRDLKGILRRALYFICDTKLFSDLPGTEAEVHDRLEGVLRCQFSDLKRKPSLSKSIKNFEPDTGIPSCRTLIEYKFVNTKLEAKRVVDEILADTRGYRSPPWDNLLFVIYETHRVLPEEEWKTLLSECELDGHYDAIVLSGDPKPSRRTRRESPSEKRK
jgi:hypothetical protein